MQGRITGSGILLILMLCFSMNAASARDFPSPFEDPVTHLWGYRDPNGFVVIKPRFTVARDFSVQGLAAVADQSGWKFIDRKGKVLIKPYLLDNGPDPFQEGLARFKKAGKIGFFDERGRIVIPPRFEFAAPFSEDRAAFCRGCREVSEGEHRTLKGGSWGFIDKIGRIVISPRFQKAKPFEQGKAEVMHNGHWMLIDKKGEPIR